MMRSVTAEASMQARYKYTDADFILQGGYRVGYGPTESELMEKLLEEFSGREIFLDRVSMNTIEGAQEIRKIAEQYRYKNLVIISQRIHAWRVALTFRMIFKGSGIKLEFVTVSTPFGGNSQKRLNSATSWWPWEIMARIATPLLIWKSRLLG